MSSIATPNQKVLLGLPPTWSERALVNHPTQSATTIDGWSSVWFGLPFLAAGIFIGVIALGGYSASKHAPDWLIGLAGFFFFAAGAFLILHGARGIARKAAYARELQSSPHQPWLADFPWQRAGFTFSAFNEMLKRFLAALCWTAFMVPFFWAGLSRHGHWIFAVFATIFTLLGLVFWSRWLQMLRELLRYGNSFLAYNAFPYFLGSTFSARLRIPNHVSDFDQLTVTFRCVQERYIASGTGRSRKSSVVCFELYSESKTFQRSDLSSFSGRDIPLEFSIPENVPATSLVSTPPNYWEIEAAGKSPGASYEAFFLVPIYKPV